MIQHASIRGPLDAEHLENIDVYLGYMKKLMVGGAQPDTLPACMEEMRDLIRDYVYADTKRMYTNTQFEGAMTTDIGGGGRYRQRDGYRR